MKSETNHQQFLRSLTHQQKRELTSKTNKPAIFRLAVLISLLTVSSLGLLSELPYRIILLLPQALLIISLFHLLHECIHDTPFRTKLLNTAIGAACGFILFLPSEWFRYFHRDHHRYTQIEGKDPELETGKPESRSQWLLHISGFPVFKSLLTVIAQCAAGNISWRYVPESTKPLVTKQACIMLAGYITLICCSLLLSSTALLTLWILPLIIGQPFLRLYLLAEHTLCQNTDNMFLNTRTVLSNPVVRWFTWNMPFHTEHHVYPAVPFHHLPALHKNMNRFLAHTNQSYSEFNKHYYDSLK